MRQRSDSDTFICCGDKDRCSRIRRRSGVESSDWWQWRFRPHPAAAPRAAQPTMAAPHRPTPHAGARGRFAAGCRVAPVRYVGGLACRVGRRAVLSFTVTGHEFLPVRMLNTLRRTAPRWVARRPTTLPASDMPSSDCPVAPQANESAKEITRGASSGAASPTRVAASMRKRNAARAMRRAPCLLVARLARTLAVRAVTAVRALRDRVSRLHVRRPVAFLASKVTGFFRFLSCVRRHLRSPSGLRLPALHRVRRLSCSTSPVGTASTSCSGSPGMRRFAD